MHACSSQGVTCACKFTARCSSECACVSHCACCQCRCHRFQAQAFTWPHHRCVCFHMARLFRRDNREAPRAPPRSSFVDFGSSTFGKSTSHEHDLSLHRSAALHSPSSWQPAQKLHSLPPSKRPNRSSFGTQNTAAATAYELHSESSRPLTPLVPSDFPSTPNAAVRIQRALTPKQPRIPSGNVMPTPTSSRPSTAAGSSLPPHNISGHNVPSVEYFAASEAAVMRRSSQSQREHTATSSGGRGGQPLNRRQLTEPNVAGKGRRHAPASTSPPPVSSDPVVKLAASVLDSSVSSGSARSGTVLFGLQQELNKLEAYRALELDRVKAAIQRPPTNLLMRDRNLPEAEPSEHGKMELSLRNRWVAVWCVCVFAIGVFCRAC